MVSTWARSLYGVMRVERLSPPVASRLAAYATAAMYAGLAAGSGELPPLTGVLNGIPDLPRSVARGSADPTLTTVAAVRLVLDSLLGEALPTTRSAIARLADSLSSARVRAGVAAQVRSRSDSLGGAIGVAIVGWSRTDRFDATRGRQYVPPVGPGLWVNDAPASLYATQNLSGVSELVALDNPANQLRGANVGDRALVLSRPKKAVRTIPAVDMAGASEPYWGEVRPFALTRWDECAVPESPAYSTDTGSDLRRNAAEVHATRANLTPEQRTIALYWADNAGESGTPAGHWISIAAQMVDERALTADEAARLMLLAAVAQADAFIASWGYKYRFNLIRPRTYIRRLIDPAWEPLIPTPPFPEFPAGHSTQSAAAAEVLTAFLGDTPFTDSTSVSLGHAARSFPSFRAAADEAGMSRIYGGIHFPVGNTSGSELGRCIGEKVMERWRRSVKGQK